MFTSLRMAILVTIGYAAQQKKVGGERKKKRNPGSHVYITANGHLGDDRIRSVTAAVAKDPEHVLYHEPGVTEDKEKKL